MSSLLPAAARRITASVDIATPFLGLVTGPWPHLATCLSVGVLTYKVIGLLHVVAFL